MDFNRPYRYVEYFPSNIARNNQGRKLVGIAKTDTVVREIGGARWRQPLASSERARLPRIPGSGLVAPPPADLDLGQIWADLSYLDHNVHNFCSPAAAQ